MATVLIIEDNLEIRENTTEILELEGHRVISAPNGREGLELAKEKLPDIILCDIMMPLMNGYEVLLSLKEDPSTAHISFIFLTARTEKSQKQAGMDLGADEYINKPFEVSDLLGAIERLLNKTR